MLLVHRHGGIQTATAWKLRNGLMSVQPQKRSLSHKSCCQPHGRGAHVLPLLQSRPMLRRNARRICVFSASFVLLPSVSDTPHIQAQDSSPSGSVPRCFSSSCRISCSRGAGNHGRRCMHCDLFSCRRLRGLWVACIADRFFVFPAEPSLHPSNLHKYNP